MTDYYQRHQVGGAFALLFYVRLHGAPSQSERNQFFKSMRRHMAREGYLMNHSKGWCVIAPLLGQSSRKSRHHTCDWLIDQKPGFTAEAYFPVNFRQLLTPKRVSDNSGSTPLFRSDGPDDLLPQQDNMEALNAETAEIAERVRRVSEGLLLQSLSWLQLIIAGLGEGDHV
jgi:hypothetical protein